MHLLKAYLRFLFGSQNQHGLHSPFVYDLVTKCFYDKNKYAEYKLLKDYREDILKDTSVIKVKDFGAGSRVFKSDERKVSEIAKNAGISLRRSQFLFRLCKYLNCENVLELGTSLGLATSALALNKNAQITSIEGCPQTASVAEKQFKKFNLDNIELKIGEFEEVLNEMKEKREEERKNNSFDLVYFDGNHTKEATLNYFELLLPKAHNNSVFVFDDIHWSPGMEEAWETIKEHPQIRVSIDTFYLGLIFFRREQEKQHFTIRM